MREDWEGTLQDPPLLHTHTHNPKSAPRARHLHPDQALRPEQGWLCLLGPTQGPWCTAEAQLPATAYL